MGASRRGKRGRLPRDLAAGERRFRAWRRRRQVGSRIPQPLWALAVRLAKAHGVARTSSVLRLDYYSLKKRLEAAGGHSRGGSKKAAADSNAPAFVELPTSVMARQQCLLEVDNGTGATLRLQLTGYEAAEVARLACGLWNRE
jgi:hypothetical protein